MSVSFLGNLVSVFNLNSLEAPPKSGNLTRFCLFGAIKIVDLMSLRFLRLTLGRFLVGSS